MGQGWHKGTLGAIWLVQESRDGLDWPDHNGQDASGHIKTGVGGEMLPLGDVICVNFNPREVGFQRWRALWRPTPKCLWVEETRKIQLYAETCQIVLTTGWRGGNWCQAWFMLILAPVKVVQVPPPAYPSPLKHLTGVSCCHFSPLYHVSRLLWPYLAVSREWMALEWSWLDQEEPGGGGYHQTTSA